MDTRRAGRALRSIRERQRLRQVDLAVLTRCSASTASRIERGEWAGLTFASIDAHVSALGATWILGISWRGAELDRILDEGHSLLIGRVVQLLADWGWETHVEVSYSIFGERGSIDVLAWHAPSGTLLVIEVKTELRPLDAKVRLAARIARDQFGWRAARVARIVVFPEDRTVRRHVMRHRAVLERALPVGTVAVRTWLRAPAGSLSGYWF
jgi:transcriptional regulator with XRE-family HTH domain